MSKVLVTGASGHLGANLVRRLLAEGQAVRVLLRRGSNNAAVDGLDVERVFGDLKDRDSLAKAVSGASAIYHCAAKISTLELDEEELFASNVLGTRNLLRAARDAGCGRVVVTGSFSAVGHPADRPANEDDPFNVFDRAMPYEKSKADVEHECLKAVVEGQDVVIATSCAILGPNDYKPSRMGALLRDWVLGRFHAYIPGGFEFVAARDIAEGHLLAMKKGRTGQKYIISSGHVAIDDLMAIFERVTGTRPRPLLRLRPDVMAVIAEVTHFVGNTFFPTRPQRLTPGAVRILRQCRTADITKARTELGYQPTSIVAAVEEAYQDFMRRGVLPRNPRAAVPVEVRTTRGDKAA